jgi:hypothetical protein
MVGLTSHALEGLVSAFARNRYPIYIQKGNELKVTNFCLNIFM